MRSQQLMSTGSTLAMACRSCKAMVQARELATGPLAATVPFRSGGLVPGASASGGPGGGRLRGAAPGAARGHLQVLSTLHT